MDTKRGSVVARQDRSALRRHLGSGEAAESSDGSIRLSDDSGDERGAMDFNESARPPVSAEFEARRASQAVREAAIAQTNASSASGMTMQNSQGRRGTEIMREMADERMNLRRHLENASRELDYESGQIGQEFSGRAPSGIGAPEPPAPPVGDGESAGGGALLPLSAARSGHRRQSTANMLTSLAGSGSINAGNGAAGARPAHSRRRSTLDALAMTSNSQPWAPSAGLAAVPESASLSDVPGAMQQVEIAVQHKQEAEELAAALAQEVQRLRDVGTTDRRDLEEQRRDSKIANEKLNAEREKTIKLKQECSSLQRDLNGTKRELKASNAALKLAQDKLEDLADQRSRKSHAQRGDTAKLRQESSALQRDLQGTQRELKASNAALKLAQDKLQSLSKAHEGEAATDAVARKLEAERETWAEERSALRESYSQLQEAQAEVQARLERRSDRLRRARAKIEALNTQLHSAHASLAVLREQQGTEHSSSRIAQAASAATAAALRDTSFAEQTCARIEQLLLRAQFQQRQQQPRLEHYGGAAGDLSNVFALHGPSPVHSPPRYSAGAPSPPQPPLGQGQAWTRLEQVLGQ